MPYIQANSAIKDKPFKSIISLVPSITELLHELTLNSEVKGITKFCIHPKNWLKEKVIIGGTKNLNLEKIKVLQPDLIIANKEENVKAQIDDLANDYNVYLTDITTYDDGLQFISAIGQLTNKNDLAQNLIKDIETQFQLIDHQKQKCNCIYLIWNDPIMVAGKNTYIDAMLEKVGFINLINESRYPELSLETMKVLNPDYIFLSSEPFPFGEKHIQSFRKEMSKSNIQLVDGELFSWYGSRMKYLPAHINSIKKPTV
jgi:ABC-type Fe3+-hydroxamate transport system substrate-binding protein